MLLSELLESPGEVDVADKKGPCGQAARKSKYDYIHPNACTAEVVDQLCDQLNIVIQVANEVQLQAMKCARVVPPTTTRAGLIRKSDAARLCAAMRAREEDASNTYKVSTERLEGYAGRTGRVLPVYHGTLPAISPPSPPWGSLLRKLHSLRLLN